MLRKTLTKIFIPLSNINPTKHCSAAQNMPKFETVFKFPFIKYIAIFNRLKVYQIVGSAIVVPGSLVLELTNVLPAQSSLAAAYIGVTATSLLCLSSLPMKNIIGFLYISEDNQQIKISYIDFWGRRKDRIILQDTWLPLLDLPQKITDLVYLSPRLTDGTRYKLFLKHGQVMNSLKISNILE